MFAPRFLVALTSLLAVVNAYWLNDLTHQGVAPHAEAGYSVFRNVKDYGARGDGVTDDTAAIMKAMLDQGRCGTNCDTTTSTTPAIVYFPGGTYVLSKSIELAYFTQMIGDPTDRPVLKATSDFAGFGLIDGNVYTSENLHWISTNVFFRQVRNFVLDTTAVPAANAATGIHWPASQATSLQNIEFNMPTDAGVVHVGLFIEEGSGGLLTDLTFNGGATGASMGNQQFTTKNLVFNNCKTAIIQLWDWGWTYTGLTIKNSDVAIDISASGENGIATGSIILIDSSVSDCGTLIKTARTSTTTPATAGSVIIENVDITNVPVAVEGPSGTLLAGGTKTIAAWGSGHQYTPNGPNTFQGTFKPNSRPASLLGDNGRFYTRSKPQYEDKTAADFVSVRASGAVGDGNTDDTAALQSAIDSAASSGKVLFLDYGVYRITDTITIPDGAIIAGEAFPTILSSGANFADKNSPRAVLKVGANSGDAGHVELTDFFVSGRGAQGGAVFVEWNLASTGGPSGMWDVHVRIGGFTGSELQVAQCKKQPGVDTVKPECVAGFASMHVTKQASGLYMENCWLWTGDHDIDDADNTQITIFNGRGLYIESQGPVWQVGTGSEHHVLYNFNLVNAKDVWFSQAQSETPYYQPSPNPPTPFTRLDSWNDPTYPAGLTDAWALRIKDSSDILFYGAGFYSFFNDYSQACVTIEAGANCQTKIVNLEGNLSNVNFYTLNTIGSVSMIDRDGNSLAKFSDNANVYPSNIALFRSG